MEDRAGVIAPPPLIYLAGLGAGLGLDMLLGSADPAPLLRWPLGALLAVAGLALMRSFLVAFRRADTAVEPWRPTTAIVTDGPYRLSRNPGYLGMALLYCGIVVLAAALWAFAALPVVLVLIDRGVIAREERYLERKFGDQYLAYRRRVRRWI